VHEGHGQTHVVFWLYDTGPSRTGSSQAKFVASGVQRENVADMQLAITTTSTLQR